ncbi:hypothetical protein EDD80_104178 [Anseongella ginsenosidimutans]|uniref:Pimeloyl-ACP methyl ester carboxylesterase n=2 Tax=Anseongella ginsenosidimutans TaxID=496056 RepID=A0A4R3KVE0_9SPHI|nr:hypothetical protein EDD80_104178 [Anseongella ginsenosidimutans]
MGADQRLFSRLNAGKHELCPVSWLKPGRQDTLATYARKLLPQISDAANSALLGVSMGGMIAIELAKLTPFKKIILISSAKTFHELPPYLRKVGNAGWYKKITARRLIRLRQLAAPLMNRLGGGYRVSGQMIKDTDPEFLDWCMKAVLTWNNETIPANLIHIHGTADLLLPARYISGYIPVKRGSHLIIYQQANKINELLHGLPEES